jgi:hypothetical protein
MLDHVDPRIFWPALIVAWFVIGLIVGLFVGKIAKWCDSEPRNHYDDHVAERHRRNAQNGFKARQGIR